MKPTDWFNKYGEINDKLEKQLEENKKLAEDL